MKRFLALFLTLCMLCTSALAATEPSPRLSFGDMLSLVAQSLLQTASVDDNGNVQLSGGTLTLDVPMLEQDFSLSWDGLGNAVSVGIHGEDQSNYVLTTAGGLIHCIEQEDSVVGYAATWESIIAWLMEYVTVELFASADFDLDTGDFDTLVQEATHQLSQLLTYLQEVSVPLQNNVRSILTTIANELTANGAVYVSSLTSGGSATSVTLHLDPALFVEAIFDALLMESRSITTLFELACPLFDVEAPTDQQVRSLIQRIFNNELRRTMIDLKNMDTITVNLTSNRSNGVEVWSLTGSGLGLQLSVISDGTHFSGTLTGDNLPGLQIDGFLTNYHDVAFALNIKPMNGSDGYVSFTYAEDSRGFTANFQAPRIQASGSYDYINGLTASATGGTSYRFSLKTDPDLIPEFMSVKTRNVNFDYRLTYDRLYLAFKTFDTRRDNYDFVLDLKNNMNALEVYSSFTANNRLAFDLLISDAIEEDMILTIRDVTFRLYDATPEGADPLTSLYALECKQGYSYLTFYLRTTLESAQAPAGFTAELLLETMPIATVTFTPGVYNTTHLEAKEPNVMEVSAMELFKSFTETPTLTPAAEDPSEAAADHLHYVQMDIDGYGSILLELDSSAAPMTVENFLKLVDSGFYNGLTFHRVISGSMLQGGDPKGNGTGGSGEKIKGEFKANGVENPLSHVRGVISMARSSGYDSASSQFFIMHANGLHLDGQYAAFGRVVSGMDVVDAICGTVPVLNSNGAVAPSAQPVIRQIVRVDAP